jgi:hypothetical protein
MKIYSTKKLILYLEILGIFFISLSGSALHFVFEWSGEWPPLALIAAVNESVWEHLKLAFWPGMMYALIVYPFLKRKTKNFWIAKTAGLYAMPIVIVVMFYSYLAIAGKSNLAYDISTFVLAVSAGQLISYHLMIKDIHQRSVKIIAVALLTIITVAFCLFTFLPPKFALFQDFITGKYGIIRN